MFNRNLLSILLTTTFITTTVRAEDTAITVDMLNSATDNFEWSDTSSADYPNSMSSNVNADKNFYYKYNKPDNYVTVTTDSSVGDIISDNNAVDSVNLANDSNLSNSTLTGDFMSSQLTNIGNIGAINGDWVGDNDSAYTVYNHNDGSQQSVSIGDINGNFIGTSGIFNMVADISENDNKDRRHGYRVNIGDINATIIANNTSAYGFLHNNSGTVGNITAETIINNVAYQTDGSSSNGGFINNQGIIDFYNAEQYEYGSDTIIDKPEVYSAVIGNISGNMINNIAVGDYAGGGAIYNHYGKIGDISGDMINNYAVVSLDIIDNINNINSSNTNNASGSNGMETYPAVTGGAINNFNGKIGDITSNHIKGNVAYGSTAAGGAIYNETSLNANYVTSSNGTVVWKNTGVYAQKMNIVGSTFENNTAYSTSGDAGGGAIMNVFGMGIAHDPNIEDGQSLADLRSEGYTVQDYMQMITELQSQALLDLENTSFLNNSAISASGNAYGGAIYSSGDVRISATNGYTSLFQGNKANGESNAIYMAAPDIYSTYPGNYTYYSNLILYTKTNGKIQFDDTIDGNNYNLTVIGDDGTGVVEFNNTVNNVHNFTLEQNSSVHLGIDSVVYAQNMKALPQGTVISPNAGLVPPVLTIDVSVDSANNTVNTSQIYIGQDIYGEYQVIVNALNSDQLDDYTNAIVPFLFAPNDDMSTASSFSIARVIGSPYLWKAGINVGGETSGSTWYLDLDDPTPDPGPDPEPEPDPEPDPDPEPRPDVTPEVIAGIGLHEASIEQTRSVVHNVRSKVDVERKYCLRCGFYDYGWSNRKLNNIWVLAQGDNADIDKPIDMEAEIHGIEAGLDFQGDFHNTLGLFASYRNGDYKLSGRGSKYSSSIGSDIDIDSYLGGIYYRHDSRTGWIFATLYGGIQEAEITTRDHIANFDTKGTQLGASLEFGHIIPLNKGLTLDPSLGLYYTQIDFDSTHDNVGKEYDWDVIKHLEVELGAKLEQQVANAKIYVKPSVVQTLTEDDSVVITGLSPIDTYHDQTLGRIEAGLRLGLTSALSGYAWGNYTFGSSYDAVSLGAGLNYAW